MPLQDDDLILVGRPDPNGVLPPQHFKMTWAALKAQIQALPFNNTDNDGSNSSNP